MNQVICHMTVILGQQIAWIICLFKISPNSICYSYKLPCDQEADYVIILRMIRQQLILIYFGLRYGSVRLKVFWVG